MEAVAEGGHVAPRPSVARYSRFLVHAFLDRERLWHASEELQKELR